MQERSRGSKRFDLGNHIQRPTLASIYHEEQTPAHWPPPTEANTRRAATQLPQRAPRHGLIASQLGLPMQSRAPAQVAYPPDNWQTQAAADGDWPLESYAENPAAYAPRSEFATYDEDAELQAALDLDNSQGLYDEQLGAYYGAKTPPLDLRLPPIARSHDESYAALDYSDYTPAYAVPVQAPVSRAQPASTGTYPYTRQSSQPSAAKWQTQQPIQRVAPTNTTRAPRPAPAVARTSQNRAAAKPHASAAPPRPATAYPNPHSRGANPRPATAYPNAHSRGANPRPAIAYPNAHSRGATSRPAQPRAATPAPRANANASARARTAPAQLNRSAPAQRQRRPAHTFIDDEAIVYPKSRGSSWLKSLAFIACLAAGAYAARDLITPLLQPQQPPQPAPSAAPVVPEPPTPVLEPAAPPPVAEATPVPEEPAKARRSAARAAVSAERWRERRAARRARSESGETPDPPVSSPAAAGAVHNSAGPAAQSGTLRINSRPWSQVIVDGQAIGHTPQMNLQLPAGRHQVTLINNEMELRKTLNINITPGNVTTQTVNLAE